MFTELKKNFDALSQAFQATDNNDFKTHLFKIGRFDALICYIEGMADEKLINEYVLSQSMLTGSQASTDLKTIVDRCVAISSAKQESDQNKIENSILDGLAALFIDGNAKALLLDVRGYEKRSIAPPLTQNVIMGSQEGFNENIRTNITLIRRMVRSTKLVSETSHVGDTAKVNLCILYLHGVADPKVVDSVRKRLEDIRVQIIPGAGFVEQLIEDSPYALVPQLCMTERPDRCASFLLEGQVIILVDGAPFALAAPVTFFHLMNMPDDTFMRWQYGTFVRIVRYLGLMCSLFLPAIYLSMAIYHQELIPLELLMSISAARADVPFPVLIEVLLMEFSFLLVDQSGTRIPQQLGSALGIFGALILGQAAVDASLVSPILIIIVAITALGNYAIPDASLAHAVQIMRFFYIISAVLGGFFGLSLMVFVTLTPICITESFGVPFFAPIAPSLPHNPDILFRLPLRKQRNSRSLFTKHYKQKLNRWGGKRP